MIIKTIVWLAVIALLFFQSPSLLFPVFIQQKSTTSIPAYKYKVFMPLIQGNALVLENFSCGLLGDRNPFFTGNLRNNTNNWISKTLTYSYSVGPPTQNISGTSNYIALDWRWNELLVIPPQQSVPFLASVQNPDIPNFYPRPCEFQIIDWKYDDVYNSTKTWLPPTVISTSIKSLGPVIGWNNQQITIVYKNLHRKKIQVTSYAWSDQISRLPLPIPHVDAFLMQPNEVITKTYDLYGGPNNLHYLYDGVLAE